MASRRTHISTMIHNRSVSNVCSLILGWRQRQRHGEETATSFVPRTRHLLRLQMDGSDEQEPIRKHRDYSYLNNACPYWYYIHLSTEKSNYLRLDDNNNSANKWQQLGWKQEKLSLRYGYICLQSNLTSSRQCVTSSMKQTLIWLKSCKCHFHKSYCELVNIYFQHMNHNFV